MADKLGIGIEAKLDTSQVQNEVKKLDKTLENAGKKKVDPVDDRTLRRAKELISTFETYLKLDREMARRLKWTNQAGKKPEEINWDIVYQNERHKKAKLRQLNAFLNGSSEEEKNSQSTFRDRAADIAKSGLRSTGAAGGVAASAIGTGMSSGFGAGVGALVGGLAALAVGKVAGAVSDKIDQANDNLMAYDRLKRTLGDVNVSFDTLQKVIEGSGDALKITYTEAGQLATQFAKIGNVSSESYTTLSDELKVGVGMSRAYGLDPSQGVGVMAHMRGVGMTKDTQESKRFALLIGETIAKSGAFANADHVMESIAQFATSQTRANMGRANVEGYAGQFSALYGSGTPGLDAQGVSSLMSRVNSSLTAGGAKGQPSQFFTNMLGAELGLDPFQTRIWREGGAHETLNDAFGEGSIASKMGIGGPRKEGVDLNKTFQQYTLEKLERQYGNDKGMLAEATANHLGVSMRAAGVLREYTPNQMGEMAKNVDLKNLSESGMANVGKAMFGSNADRDTIKNNLLKRSDVSEEDKKTLLNLGEKSEEQQKLVLAKLTAQYEQERTTGGDIRDSKNILDNILVTLATKIADPLAIIKGAIVSLSGKSPKELKTELEKAESKDRVDAIKSKYDAEREQINNGGGSWFEKQRKISAANKKETAEINAERAASQKRRKEIEAGKDTTINAPLTEAGKLAESESKGRVDSIKKKYEAEREKIRKEDKEKNVPWEETIKKIHQTKVDEKNEVAKEEGETQEKIKEINKNYKTPDLGGKRVDDKKPDVVGKSDTQKSPALSDITDPQQRKNAAAFLDTIGDSEGAGYNTLVGKGKNNQVITDLSKHPNIVGMRTKDGPSTAAGKYQITNSTWRDLGHGKNDSFSPEEQDKAAIALIKRRGAWKDVLNGDWDAAAKKLGKEWQSLPTGASPNQGKHSWGQFHAQIDRALKRQEGTPMPEGASAGNEPANHRITADDITIHIADKNTGKPMAPPEKLSPRVKSNWGQQHGRS